MDTWVYVLIAVVVIALLLSLPRIRRRRLVNRGRQKGGFRRRRMDALKRAAAADIAAIQGNDSVLGTDAPSEQESTP